MSPAVSPGGAAEAGAVAACNSLADGVARGSCFCRPFRDLAYFVRVFPSDKSLGYYVRPYRGVAAPVKVLVFSGCESHPATWSF